MRKTKILTIAAGMATAFMFTTGAMAADWPQFLGLEGSQGVTNALTPKTSADVAMRWEMTTSSAANNNVRGWTDVPGTPIVVGDYVYCYSSEYLRKIDLKTGKEVGKAQVYGAPVNQFFINITYAEGMIFVPVQTDNLDNDGVEIKGCFIRVYDAETLEPLYVTEQIPGGQMQSPIMYHDGYIVTGTYGRNNRYAGFTVKDEDTTKSNEIKKMSWSVETGNKYGFSFCGAAYVGDYCYFAGGDTLYIVKYKTGETAKLELGADYNSHSTLTYSSETKRLYVPANNPEGGASIFSFELGADGMPNKATALEWKSGTVEGGTQSSAVIYKGRLYIGGGGGTMGSLEPFHVVDAKTMKEIYSVPVCAKGSAAISTAYATAANNYQVYIYMVPYAPVDGESELWIIKDSQGQTKADYEVVKGVGRAQYCSQSLVPTADGGLVWYNDAAALYCYENKNAATSGTTVTTPVTTPVTGNVFTDINDSWAKDDILYLYDKKIVNGMDATHFEPESTLTRAEFAQMLAKLSGAELTKPEKQEFNDVKVNDWYAPAVAWASKTGLTNGNGAGGFEPNAKLSRQDMTVMLARYAKELANLELPKSETAIAYTDAADIADYAKEAVTTLQQGGVVGGADKNSGNKFAPKANATRAMAASAVANLTRAMQG